MNKNPSLARVLLVLGVLIVGPLQAHSAFACAMMDEVVPECCCPGHKADDECADSACDGASGDNADPCCERLVTISIDNKVTQDTPVIKPVEIRSEVDPPSGAAAAIAELKLLPRVAAPRPDFSLPDFWPSGVNTYLITQRLRI